VESEIYDKCQFFRRAFFAGVPYFPSFSACRSGDFHGTTSHGTTSHGTTKTDDGEHMTDLLRLDEIDTNCRAHWRSGAVADCRQQAQQLIEQASAADDVVAQARGWLHRARCDQFQSAYLDMLEAARRAMALLHAGESDHDLVQARVLACVAATALNRPNEAVEAACWPGIWPTTQRMPTTAGWQQKRWRTPSAGPGRSDRRWTASTARWPRRVVCLAADGTCRC
jgi:hypothetical protein